LEGDVIHESAALSADNATSGSDWHVALGAGLGGRLTVWRSLRLIGEFDVRAASGGMVLTAKDDTRVTGATSFSRWRPAFALGIELAI
jgi:hypothetical protein